MLQTRIIIGGFLLFGLGLIGLWSAASRPPSADTEPLVFIENETVFSDYVELPRLGILTGTNFLGHRIRVIEGTISNISEQTLRSVELNLEFNSFDGEIVLESLEQGLRSSLPAGEDRRYSFSFENLPPEWNYRVPEVRITRIGY
jgi:hypothetical protein